MNITNKSIFFDIYGTLAGFYPEREKIQRKILSKHNIFLSESQILSGYKEADEFMVYQKKVKPLRLMNKNELQIFFSAYESKILEKNNIFINKNKTLEIWDEISKEKYELKIFSDVYENLEYLRQKKIICAGITNMNISGKKLIQDLKLQKHLEFIITSYDCKSEKPNPKIFEYCLKKSGAKKKNSYLVGDQIESDIKGAKDFGITPILIDRYNHYKEFNLSEKISNLDGLKKIF